MKINKPVVDYRKLRLNNLNTDEFKHLKLISYWPVFGLMFLFVERIYKVDTYHVVHCRLDDMIPFNEWFLIPYLLWFIFLLGIHLYTLLYDVEAFKKLMKFIIFTNTLIIFIYIVFPTCQELRPVDFQRDNALTRFIIDFYAFDTNTNVCPSLHVTGSLAVMFTAWQAEGLRSRGWKTAFGITAILISVSTVFMKQHSVIDVLTAIPICLIGYYLYFRKEKRKGGVDKDEPEHGQNEYTQNEN